MTIKGIKTAGQALYRRLRRYPQAPCRGPLVRRFFASGPRQCCLFSVMLLFLGALNIHAQTAEKRYSFSISPILGMFYGQGEEILYKYPKNNVYISQLLWDLKPLFYLGLGLDFGPRDPYLKSGFTAAGTFKLGIPFKRAGIIEDRDWQYPDNDNLTNYSRHEAYSQRAVTVDINSGYSWRLADFLALKAYGEFSFMYFSWSAESGYYQYLKSDGSGNILPDQTWNKYIPKTPLEGKGINYTQNWFILSPGISLQTKITPRFSTEINFSYSPLVICFARDNHLLRNMMFWDQLYFGHHIKGGSTLTFSADKNLDISLSLSYRYITGLRGNSYWKDNSYGDGIVVQNKYDGGAGYSVLDIGLAAKIRFFGRY